MAEAASRRGIGTRSLRNEEETSHSRWQVSCHNPLYPTIHLVAALGSRSAAARSGGSRTSRSTSGGSRSAALRSGWSTARRGSRSGTSGSTSGGGRSTALRSSRSAARWSAAIVFLVAAQLGQLEAAALLRSAARRCGGSAARLSSRSAGRGSGTARSTGGCAARRRALGFTTTEPARFRGDAGKQNQHGGSQRCPLHYKHLLKTGVGGTGTNAGPRSRRASHKDAHRHRSPVVPNSTNSRQSFSSPRLDYIDGKFCRRDAARHSPWIVPTFQVVTRSGFRRDRDRATIRHNQSGVSCSPMPRPPNSMSGGSVRNSEEVCP